MDETGQAGGRSWIAHVMKTRAEMIRRGTMKQGDNLRKAMTQASKTFKRKVKSMGKRGGTRRRGGKHHRKH